MAFLLFNATNLGSKIGMCILKFDAKEREHCISDDMLSPVLLTWVIDLYTTLIQFENAKYTGFDNQINTKHCLQCL